MSKIILNLTFQNGDTYETDEKAIEIDLPNQFNEQLIDLNNPDNLIAFYQELISQESPCYDDILQKLTCWGYEKLGWGDVMINFNSIKVNDILYEYGDDLDDFGYELQIQLARSDEGNMMYLCN